MILNLVAARSRYFLNIFPLTFMPLIYLIKKSENKKLLRSIIMEDRKIDSWLERFIRDSQLKGSIILSGNSSDIIRNRKKYKTN